METPRKADWFFRFIAGYSLVHLAWIGVITFDFFRSPFDPSPINGSILYRWFILFGFTPGALLIAYLVIRRSPGNPTGLFLFLWAALNTGQSIPITSPLYIINGAFNTGWTGLWLLALYFPDGKPSPRRYERFVRALSVFTVLIVAVWFFFQPTVDYWNSLIDEWQVVPNPLVIPVLLPFQAVINVVEMGALLAVVALILPSMLARFRESGAVEKQQVKWLLWTYGILIGSMGLFLPSGLITGDPHQHGALGFIALQTLILYIWVAPYVAVGNAIFRHRLYDIDLVIRRTLVYSLLTASLALFYLGGVTILQGVFTALTGQNSTLSLVGSTLAIAALFHPLRRRIQAFIDRRFYRQKYNAEQALAGFSAQARSETDLDVLASQLVRVVQETMQPNQVSVWLGEGRQSQKVNYEP
jgi:hypothetical protein